MFTKTKWRQKEQIDVKIKYVTTAQHGFITTVLHGTIQQTQVDYFVQTHKYQENFNSELLINFSREI